MGKTAREIHDQYYVEKDFQRIELFRLLVEWFSVQSALYPGSFVHVSPSLVIPAVTYVDTDRRCSNFFADPTMHTWLKQRRDYAAQPEVVFIAADYLQPMEFADEAFDLLISQWAGPISRVCKRNLQVGGFLLANDSHGDASLTALDNDYELIASISTDSDRHPMNTKNLNGYFVPKTKATPTTKTVLAARRGSARKKSVGSYLFRRVESPTSR